MNNFMSFSERQEMEFAHLEEDPGFKALGQLLRRFPDLGEDVPVACQSIQDTRKMMRDGKAIGDAFPPTADGSDLVRRWKLLVKALAGEPLNLSSEVLVGLESVTPERLTAWFEQLPQRPGELSGDISREYGVSPDVAALILIYAMGPFYRSWAKKIDPGDEDLQLWDSGRCPVCGAWPHFGRLESETGGRVLECWLCGVDWNYPRLQCPYCENADQEKLGFFSPKGEDDRRVYFCRECGRYVKIIDSRSQGREPMLHLVNLATLALDLAAWKEGFRPGSELPLAGESSS